MTNLLTCKGGGYRKTIGFLTTLLSSVRNSQMPSFSLFNSPRADFWGPSSEHLMRTPRRQSRLQQLPLSSRSSDRVALAWGRTDQYDRTVGPERILYIHFQLVYWFLARAPRALLGKEQTPQHMLLGQLGVRVQKTPLSVHTHRINSKWITNLNVSLKRQNS